MKKILMGAFLVLALPSPAFSVEWVITTAKGYSAVQSTQDLTDPDIAGTTSGGGWGLQISGLGAYTVTVSADEGETLSGAGTLVAYHRDPVLGRWVRMPDADVSIPASAAGKRDFTSSALEVVGRGRGSVAYATSGVTVSGGTTVVVTLAPSGARSASLGHPILRLLEPLLLAGVR